MHPGQTFEGGISGQPNVEAHGAYAFCALGCLAILDHPSRSIPRYVHTASPLTFEYAVCLMLGDSGYAPNLYPPTRGKARTTDKLLTIKFCNPTFPDIWTFHDWSLGCRHASTRPKVASPAAPTSLSTAATATGLADVSPLLRHPSTETPRVTGIGPAMAMVVLVVPVVVGPWPQMARPPPPQPQQRPPRRPRRPAVAAEAAACRPQRIASSIGRA